MAAGFNLGTDPTHKLTYEELEAKIAKLERELERYRRAERMRVERERARPQPHRDAWMLM